MKEVQLHIDGMRCASCVYGAENHLQYRGVEDMDLDFKTSIATITYDETLITVPEIIAILERCGYALTQLST